MQVFFLLLNIIIIIVYQMSLFLMMKHVRPDWRSLLQEDNASSTEQQVAAGHLSE